MAEKISYFEMKNFRALNTLTRYLNISKIKVLIQITFCRNPRIQMALYAWVLLVFVLLHVSNFIMETEDAYRGSSTISPSSKLELLCQYEMTSTVTKNSIIDDLGVRDPLLVCLFSVQNITKKIKT